MSEAKRLHPVAIVLNAFKVLKEAFIPMVVLFFVQGGGISTWNYYEFIIPVVYLLGSIIYGTITWFRFTYRVKDDEIQIDSGLFVKKKRYIRLERIQSIDITEGILQRLFSLVQVSIETAGSTTGKAEAVLTAIPKEEGSFFQSLLKEKDLLQSDNYFSESSKKEQKENILFRMTFPQLFFMAATSGGVGVVFAGAIALYSQIAEMINIEKVYNEVEKIIASGVILILFFIVVGLLLAYIIATITILLKYAFFTLKKSGNDLIITRGLLERRSLTIPVGRIQALRIVENLIRQPLGYATVYVETTSGSLENMSNAKVMLFPIAKKKQLKELLTTIGIDYQVDVPMTHVPNRSLIRYMFRQWIWTVPVSILLIYFFQLWGMLSLLLPVLFTVYAFVCYKEASWNLYERQLTFTYREWIDKQTYIVKREKIQSLVMRQSAFQKTRELGSIVAYHKTGLGAGEGKVIDLEEQDIYCIKRWFQGRTM